MLDAYCLILGRNRRHLRPTTVRAKAFLRLHFRRCRRESDGEKDVGRGKNCEKPQKVDENGRNWRRRRKTARIV